MVLAGYPPNQGVRKIVGGKKDEKECATVDIYTKKIIDHFRIYTNKFDGRLMWHRHGNNITSHVEHYCWDVVIIPGAPTDTDSAALMMTGFYGK